MFGGASLDGPSNDLYVFDTESGEWDRPRVSGQAPFPREMHTAVMVDEKTMAVYGGRGADGNVRADCILLDTETMTWGKTCASIYVTNVHQIFIFTSDKL